MTIITLAAAFLIPPPPGGDDRTAILHSVHRFADAVSGVAGANMESVVDPQANATIVDLRDPTTPVKLVVIDRAAFLERLSKTKEPVQERVGIPTILQRGALAQVWVPYSLWIEEKRSHCGIDNFTLARRGDEWVITAISYTMEPVANCADLAAPESPQ